MGKTVLVINPGSTSTKLAVFCEGKLIISEKKAHTADQLKSFSKIWDQYEYRLDVIENWVNDNVKQCDAVVAIGGLLRPVEGGTYLVNQKMIDDARGNFQGAHVSNLGCVLADGIAEQFECSAYIVDPVSVNEYEPLAFYSGHPEVKRRALSHALNLHATARLAAKDLQIPYEKTSFIVCHIGGGISITPMRGGKIIDSNNAISEGPFSPERSGGLPLQEFITLCMSGKYTEDEIRRIPNGKGGLMAYFGTNSVEEVEKMVEAGDEKAREVYQAMAYQISKEIGAMSTVLKGAVDAIVLTGGVAHSNMLTAWVEERVKFISQVLVYPGEDEMTALAEGVHRVLTGKEQAKEY